jgi:hypothetical protein
VFKLGGGGGVEGDDSLTLRPAIQNINNLHILSYLEQYNRIFETPICMWLSTDEIQYSLFANTAFKEQENV